MLENKYVTDTNHSWKQCTLYIWYGWEYEHWESNYYGLGKLIIIIIINNINNKNKI